MNRKDLLLQKHLPTVMVPRFEPLPPLPENRSRLLMAKDGLWIEVKTPWGLFIKRIFESSRHLPYGSVRERTELLSGPIPIRFLEQFVNQANGSSQRGLETAAWIIWSAEKGWEYLQLDILERTRGSVAFRWPELVPERHLVLDMHSHGAGPAFFSKTDNRSDQGTAHFSLVVGNCKGGRPLAELDMACRLCLAGFFFDYYEGQALGPYPRKALPCGIT
ncbi:MAG: PRTRC system protein A [Nitrospiria bacterium]